MTRTVGKIGLLVSVCMGLTVLDAAAWGPRAQRAITGTSIQVVRRTYADAYKTYDFNYEEDVFYGAEVGPEFLNAGRPFASDADAIAAVENEIRLLRTARKYRYGSYFSFRMGVLGSLVADIMLPFALDGAPQTQKLRRDIESDIDAHVAGYRFESDQADRQRIRVARDYFKLRREFHNDAKRMIADDYRRGRGYDGYLKQAGQAFFVRSVDAVSDAWSTVLQVADDAGVVDPSPDVLAWYFVDEIRYLLEEKANFYQAEKTYAFFEHTASDLPDAYEKVGDLFYAFNTVESRQRAVREWRIANNADSVNRQRVGNKLAAHYIAVGEAALAKAALPGASDDDLPNALNAFSQALSFDQSNQTAAARIEETNVAIARRQEHHAMQVNILASAESTMEQAERQRLAGDFGNALATYDQAASLLEGIDNTFKDQEKAAENNKRAIKKHKTDIINDVLDAAGDAIDAGDRARDNREYEAAIQTYGRVPAILSVIPADESTALGKDKQEYIETAQNKIEEAKQEKMRETQRQQDLQDQAKQGVVK
ncbi:MAG: hypothetical protein GWP08_15665 [Nitrospiraceae bacterium]|nr:hypothetical protein [Nitrospiraceae bacterium]